MSARRAVAGRKRGVGARLWHNAALIFGSLVFAAPFLWLVTTTFKSDEEVFIFPPRLPRLPSHVTASPYPDPHAFPPLRRPEALDPTRWEEAGPHLHDLLVRRADELLRNIEDPKLIDDWGGLVEQVARGLWGQIVAVTPDAAWNLPDAQIRQALLSQIDDTSVRGALEKVLRDLRLGRVSFTDTNGDETNVAPTDDLAGWRCTAGSARLVPYPSDPNRPARLVYDTSGGDVVCQVTVETPCPPDELDSLTIPVCEDASFHSLLVEVVTSERRWTASSPAVIRTGGARDVLFRFPGCTRISHGQIRLRSTDGGDPTLPDRTARITVRLHPVPYAVAVARKFTASYRDTLGFVPMLRYTANSVFLVVMNVAGQLLACSLVAFSFARLRWPGRDWCFLLLIATMMLPPQVTIIPVFVIFSKIGWFDTFLPLWVPSFFGAAFFIFLLRQSMLGIPADLEDAAKIDGCGYFRMWREVMLPLVKPTLAAIAIFTFMNSWNDFFGPLVYISSPERITLPLGLFLFRSAHGGEWAMMMAAATLMTAPVIVVFFLAQKYFIQGVTLTGIKG